MSVEIATHFWNTCYSRVWHLWCFPPEPLYGFWSDRCWYLLHGGKPFPGGCNCRTGSCRKATCHLEKREFGCGTPTSAFRDDQAWLQEVGFPTWFSPVICCIQAAVPGITGSGSGGRHPLANIPEEVLDIDPDDELVFLMVFIFHLLLDDPKNCRIILDIRCRG